MKTTNTARVGRPKSEEKRRAIMHASTELFLRQGFRNTSMDAIASEAGVSKQTVYSHFDGKDALLRACVKDKVEQYGLDAENFPLDLPLSEALRRIARQFMELINDDNVVAMYRLLIAEAREHPALSRAFDESGPQPTQEAMAHFLSEHPEGQDRFDDPLFAAETFFVLLEHTAMMRRLLNLGGAMTDDERMAHATRVSDALLRIYPAHNAGH